jgi:uncharacterized protein (TIGR03067 family)
MTATPDRFRAAILCTALALLSAGVALGDDAKDSKDSPDLKNMQGSWSAKLPSGDDAVFTFKDDKMTVKSTSRTYKITVTLDDKAKPDKTIDMHIDEAPEDARDKTSKGIYKFDGDDKLQICFRPEGERPTKYETIENDQYLVELTRKKD